MSRLYNSFLEKLVLPVGDLLNRSSVMNTMQLIDKEISLPEQELLLLQKEKLKKLLRFASKNCNYYQGKDLLIEDDIENSLRKFPIIDKMTIRAQAKNLIANNKEKLYSQFSSGSTGIQTKVFWSRKEFNRYRATTLLWWKWAGYDLGDYLLQTGMASKRHGIKAIKDVLFRTNYLKAYSHKIEDLDKAINWLKRKKYPVLGGYASSLYVIAKRADQLGERMHLKACISWGDKLFDHYKSKIKSVFNIEVHETYGSAEGFLIAAQCDLPYMYIMSNNVYVEIVNDDGKPVEDGEIGHVLVTNLNNFSMPLIRYRIGDLAAILPKNKYPEKRKYNLPLLQKVIGRDTDIIKVPSGEHLTVHSFTRIFEFYEEIEQFQIIQKNIDAIEIRYIKGNLFDKRSLLEIREKILREVKDKRFSVYFSCVDNISPSKSGKPQIVISDLNN